MTPPPARAGAARTPTVDAAAQHTALLFDAADRRITQLRALADALVRGRSVRESDIAALAMGAARTLAECRAELQRRTGAGPTPADAPHPHRLFDERGR